MQTAGSVTSPPLGPAVLPEVMAFGPGEAAARFQLIAADSAGTTSCAEAAAGWGVSVPVSTTQEPEGRAGSWHFRAWPPGLGNAGQCVAADRGPERKSPRNGPQDGGMIGMGRES